MYTVKEGLTVVVVHLRNKVASPGVLKVGSARMFYSIPAWWNNLEWFAGPYRETSQKVEWWVSPPGSPWCLRGRWTCSCPTSQSTHSTDCTQSWWRSPLTARAALACPLPTSLQLWTKRACCWLTPCWGAQFGVDPLADRESGDTKQTARQCSSV